MVAFESVCGKLTANIEKITHTLLAFIFKPQTTTTRVKVTIFFSSFVFALLSSLISPLIRRYKRKM